MSDILNSLFDKLGYNKDNGLYLLAGDIGSSKFQNFPHRIGRVLREIIKPYAIFSIENESETSHVKPFNVPLIIFYDNPTELEYEKIAKHTFNLSRAPVVFISNDLKGTCEIFNGYSFSDQNTNWLSKIDLKDDYFSISNLRNGKIWEILYNRYFKNSKTVDKYLLSNITDCRRILVSKNEFSSGKLLPEIANKLIGRIIFIRYLIDRGVEFNGQTILIGNDKETRQTNFTDILLSKEKTYLFFKFIADKFKGDLFPLEFIKDNKTEFEVDYVNEDHLMVLYHLLSCSSFFSSDKKINSNYTIQKSLFQYYDFEIIPVELISNIYESFLGSSNYAKDENKATELTKQKQVQAYYTPPFIVDYILSQTVNKHLKSGNGSSCRVLDPSCGSGIFLVETLRQIIETELKFTNKPISNERLWELVQDNIFGIDIDSNAIEITTFSLYITLLDYKKYPKEIEEFKFKPLKDKNLFSGADFFDINHNYNNIFQNDIELDFIIGNPPWGKVKDSSYKQYIKNRKISENNSKCQLEIGGEEISQAFLIRVSDLIQKQKKAKFCFIVTGKNFYNSNSHQWRKYFLSNYKIIQFFDLFGVQNKVAGGHQIFENAKQPAAICLYEIGSNLNNTNNIQHIVARANKFFNYFKTILIEKNDVKSVSQEMFIKHDWLWKTLLYGNSLDFFFINRLLEDFKLPDASKKNKLEFDGLEFEYHGGYKAKDDGVKNKKDTTPYHDFRYLEVDGKKDLIPFRAESNTNFIDKLNEDFLKKRINEDLKVAQLPEEKFLTGKRLLLKKGIEIDKECNYKAVSAFTEKNYIFSSTIASIIPKKGTDINESEKFFYVLSAIINSNLFIYLSLMKSSSFGADRNRVNFEEFFEIPIAIDDDLLKISKKLHQEDDPFKQNDKNLLDSYISKAYNISEQEQSIIDYAIDVSIPIMRRVGRLKNNSRQYLFKSIKSSTINYLKDYAKIFYDHFSKRFNSQNRYFYIDAYIEKDYIALNFIISSEREEWFSPDYNSNLNDIINKIGNLGFNSITKDLFYQQDVRGFNTDSFYIIKPNEVKNWHKALAYIDLNDFIDALTKAELDNLT